MSRRLLPRLCEILSYAPLQKASTPDVGWGLKCSEQLNGWPSGALSSYTEPHFHWSFDDGQTPAGATLPRHSTACPYRRSSCPTQVTIQVLESVLNQATKRCDPSGDVMTRGSPGAESCQPNAFSVTISTLPTQVKPTPTQHESY